MLWTFSPLFHNHTVKYMHYRATIATSNVKWLLVSCGTLFLAFPLFCFWDGKTNSTVASLTITIKFLIPSTQLNHTAGSQRSYISCRLGERHWNNNNSYPAGWFLSSQPILMTAGSSEPSSVPTDGSLPDVCWKTLSCSFLNPSSCNRLDLEQNLKQKYINLISFWYLKRILYYRLIKM